MHIYTTKGTCSEKILFDIEDGIVTDCKFLKGCSGNLQGMSKLVIGRKVEDVIDMLKGIKCQNGTSCPDQLALALEDYVAANPPANP